MEKLELFHGAHTARQIEGRLVYSVSAINSRIGSTLQADEMLSDIWLEGEVSSFKLHPPSGHYYFNLKDSASQIGCVVYRGVAASIPSLKILDDGAMVLARGDISPYHARGSYSLRIKDIRILGRGDLYILFEELKKKLEKEGLFDEARKRPLPRFPETIGVVTSESGAALQDILNILKRRYPIARIILAPALVQGEAAPASIKRALEKLDGTGRADIIIVGRGGGSMEDLWCFNDEELARSIAACSVPVISAVGHETDFTISDFVADKRAPTPSAAAEIAAPDVSDFIHAIDEAGQRMRRSILGMFEAEADFLISLEERLESRNPIKIIEQGHNRCDELESRLLNTVRNMLENLFLNMETWDERLENSSLPNIIKKGYALIMDAEGRIITSTDSVEKEMDVEIEIADGRLTARITGVKKHGS